MTSSPPIARPLSALRGLLPFLRPHRGRVALAFVLLCLGSAAILVVPLAFRDLIDAGFGGDVAGAGLFGAQGLDGRFVALVGLALFWAVVVAARYYTVSWIGERVTADLRSAVYARVLHQSPQFFETLQTGERALEAHGVDDHPLCRPSLAARSRWACAACSSSSAACSCWR